MVGPHQTVDRGFFFFFKLGSCSHYSKKGFSVFAVEWSGSELPTQVGQKLAKMNYAHFHFDR